ncbi:MAG: helix-turn-helix transcriptional regulator [Patescibacteria group bacterium]|nr:helix-turn-helix transcriptional regulator [Patescibacteria group bacterium]MDE2438005.1 helix-turn-helix transcriptional regulator [Patescibacteria group bacterium]
MKTPTSKLGKNIKRIREQKEMSQGDICRAVGFDRAQMSNIDSRSTYLVEVPGGSEKKWIETFNALASVKFAERNTLIDLPKPWEPR